MTDTSSSSIHLSFNKRSAIKLAMAFSAALLLAVPALAEVYKHVDKNGKVSYSDQPAKGAQPVDVKPANSIPAVKVTPKLAAETAAEGVEKVHKYRRLEITQPADDSAIEHGPGNFSVTVRVMPELHEDHKLQLLIDGKPHGKAGRASSFQLTNVDRGTHELKAQVLGKNGKAVKTSKANSVHVFRPSIAHPGNRR